MTDAMTKRISKVLISGVLISSFFILLGIIMTIKQNNFTFNQSEYTFSHLINGLFQIDSKAYLMMGIFILILTPIIRLLGMLVQFIIEKNTLYVAISTIVLVVLVISFFMGITH